MKTQVVVLKEAWRLFRSDDQQETMYAVVLGTLVGLMVLYQYRQSGRRKP